MSVNKDGAQSGLFRGLSKKPDLASILNDISGILDPLDMEIIVVRGKTCEVLFANAKAEARLQTDRSTALHCKTGYSCHFPGLCDRCPYSGKELGEANDPFEVMDTGGQTYTARQNMINWTDGKPAAIFVLRDVTMEIETRERLYALAYSDQLTGVPNRQKLKEDFTALEQGISNNELTGVVALFDLDFFKAINDTYGHNTGDIVLRRLTEHLQEERAFAGHLYRLGGDEFVLLYVDQVGQFPSEEEMLSFYYEVLSGALHSYTLPTIDLKCTLSIGVSVFPKHGVNLSEILRKADIALYKAKEAGRNQVVFFTENYDSAQKFKDMYINIQPVLLSDGRTFGYELVDRGACGEEDETTVTLSEFNRTLDAMGLNDIENTQHYFISYTRQLISPAVLKHLPRDKFIVQMSLPAKITKPALQKVLKTYMELRKNNYKLALTGLDSGSPVQEIVNLADYCKFSEADTDLERQKRFIAANPKVKFIAAGIDGMAEFHDAKAAGFHLFQGYYFSNPVVGQKTKEISPLKVNYFRLLKLSSTDGYLDFREISAVIASDVALSYKLLRILNSAAVGLRNVSSIANAVAYMGEESLKKWIAVLALRGIAEDKPLELVRLSLIRARFGELLAPYFKIRRNPKQAFMVGMLSLLHVALEKTREQVLEDIPVAEDVRTSLLTNNGVYSGLLKFFENYEYANWDAVSQFVEEQDLSAAYVNDSYISSVKWYNELVK